MSLFGTLLTVLIGPVVPVPAPPQLLEALERVEVQHAQTGRVACQITFRAGREAFNPLDYFLLSTPLLRPFSRVVLTVTLNGLPQVLFDGFITNQQLAPGDEPGGGRLTVTAEDVGVMMDLEERSAEHPAQDETVIAYKLIGSYVQYGLIPTVIPPPVLDPPLPTDRTPVQQGTDYDYLEELAQRHGYVFFITPGPAPLTNLAYWGPPPRLSIPQRALSVNMGSQTNVSNINFTYDALQPHFVAGEVQDRLTGNKLPVRTFASTRVPLVSQPAWLTQSDIRVRAHRDSGTSVVQAYARAQAETDRSQDRVVTATGQLDALRYGGMLQPRALVGLRGAGYSYDGIYYVERVTHTLEGGSYTQSFSLAREGLGAISPVVIP